MTAKTTKMEIRKQLQEWDRRISVCRGNGHCETVFPASWAGHNVGDYPNTSWSGNQRYDVLAMRAGQYYGIELFAENKTLSGLVNEIYDCLAIAH